MSIEPAPCRWLQTGCSLLVVAALLHGLAAAQESAAAAEDPETLGNVIREQTIYIPYDKLRRTFEQQGRGVFLPYEKFQQLWKAARDNQPRPREVTAPVKAVITEITNEAQVENDVLRVNARLTIDLLATGWMEVPLRLNDAALLSATIDGEPARLLVGDSGEQQLLLNKQEDGPRQIELLLEYAKSISKAPGQNSVAFKPPLAPVNRWRIRIPERGVKVNVHPMLAATEVPDDRLAQAASDTFGSEGQDELIGDQPVIDAANEANTDIGEETILMAFVGAAPDVRIDWTPKAEGASGLDALVSVQTQQRVTIDEGVIRTATRLDYEISRAELSELTIEVPANQKIVNVAEANVRQWNVQQNGEVQTISIGLFQPARSRQAVNVELEAFDEQAGGTYSIPAVKAVGVNRQRGIVVVRSAEDLRTDVLRRSGLLQLDTAEVPVALRQEASEFSYRYASLPFELDLRVEKIEPRIHVDQLVEAYLQPDTLHLHLFARYSIQLAGVFELELDLPPDFEVRSVRGREAAGATASLVDSHVVEDVGAGRRLKVNLSGKALGDVGLQVELEKRLEDANLVSPTGESSALTVAPPRASEESIQRSTGRLLVYAPESLRITIGELSGLRNISFDEALQNSESSRETRFADTRPVQAFAFAAAPASAELLAQRRQPQVTAQQLLIARINPGVAKYEATFYFDIRYSGVKSLRIDVPAELASRIRNQSASLREQVIDPPPDDLGDGDLAWRLSGETELLGRVQCKLVWETPVEQLGIGQSEDFPVPRLTPRGVERSSGQIVLVKSETIDVQPKGEPTGLNPIDPQHDLFDGLKISDAMAALEFHDQWDLTLTATRYELESLKHTSIEQAVLRMVITRSDRVSVQALYRMRSNRQRLTIQLPDDVAPGKIEFDTDPVRINGQRLTLERGDDSQTFAVPLVGLTANEPFVLELRYTMAGGSQLAYPTFPDEPAVQKVNLVAYVPNEQTYLGKQGPWTDETDWVFNAPLRRTPSPRHDVNTLVGKLTQGIRVSGNPADEFPTDGNALLFSTLRPPAPADGALTLRTLNGNLLHGMVFGIVALSGVLLLRRPAVDRIAFICLLGATLVLIGVFLPVLANAILNHVLVLAVFVVALLWLAVFSFRVLPKLGRLRIGRSPSPAEAAVSAAVSTSASPGPAEATPAADDPKPSEGSDEGRKHDV